MDDLRTAIITDFGNGYASFGNSELMGRIVGLLLCASEPMTVEQIAEALRVSKSPVNQICNRLEEVKLIRRAWVKGGRKYHYEIVDNVFLQASLNLSRLTEGNVQIAERNLQLVAERYKTAPEPEREALLIIAQRLLEMREFHRKLIESYQRFIEDWRSLRARLPQAKQFLEA
ncbi:MAG: MarR family transcriptional regulator [candidate division KSB1 bacterium]|nr:MarR family transcriptional regulator [candidate division KSB1 bacterium]MDZ7275669.1 MarR family transcriptional regulator [candidate division KSB1 bacterium]MDZ7284640.1 MarR family transcriptional regulator [candidate division KSB1 bacterium]MDZ7297941.1 MarR family transcriptional regulator [candidate division KSB1 bacterium]MDZ7309564.1 MarR family transcriptional regulator [candidate division KSB1 bacterium]